MKNQPINIKYITLTKHLKLNDEAEIFRYIYTHTNAAKSLTLATNAVKRSPLARVKQTNIS